MTDVQDDHPLEGPVDDTAALLDRAPAKGAPAGDAAETAALLDHDYDGIREYDNPLPGWWKGVFLLTILFTPFYLLHYHGGRGQSVYQEYAADVEAHQALLRAQQAAQPVEAFTDESLQDLQRDEAVIAAGREKFRSLCSSCHGPDGQGLVGPNLTDGYWLHGGKPTQILRTIREGVPEKGMIAWGQMLAPDELANITAFVTTLRGTNPPNPKKPEGTPVDASK